MEAKWKSKSKGPLEHEGGKRFFTTQNAKTTFWEEIKRDVALGKALKCFGKAGLLMFGGSGWVPAGERMLPVMLAQALQNLWRKPIWEGVWPHVDRWDSVRLRTVSMHRNVPGKYEPHGELFFF